MDIVEDHDPCRRTAILQAGFGIAGAFLGFWTGVYAVARMLGRRNPPVK